MRFFKIAALAAAAVSAPAVAIAAPPPTTMDGSFAAGIIGINASDALIGLDTTFTVTGFTGAAGGKGDFASINNLLTLSPVTATKGTTVSFTSDYGDYLGTVSVVNPSGPTNNRVVSLYVLGDFTPKNKPQFKAGAASLTFSFTQTGGSGSAVSGSFTLASPPAPAPGVPEPASWAMMIGGFALTGAAVRRRRATTPAAA